MRNGIWAGVFVTCFLFFFKPFGTSITPGHEWAYLAVCAGFGLVTLSITLLFNGICFLFPKVFEEENWKVGKEILFNLLFISCIGMGNLLFANLLWKVPLNGRTFWNWQLITFAVGVFPSFFGVLLTQMKWSKRYAEQAATMHLPAVHPTLHAQVTLTGENQNEILTLQADRIVYLAAQDNYVQVFYLEKEQLKSKMLRATLRKLEEILVDWPQFVRCHRTFVANFDLVEKVSGNAQGYRLHLHGVEETIPVSRNLNEMVRNRLHE